MANLSSYIPKAVRSKTTSRRIYIVNQDPEFSASDGRLSFVYPLANDPEGSFTLTFLPGQDTPIRMYKGFAPKGYKNGSSDSRGNYRVTVIEGPDGSRSDGHGRRLRFVYEK